MGGGYHNYSISIGLSIVYGTAVQVVLYLSFPGTILRGDGVYLLLTPSRLVLPAYLEVSNGVEIVEHP